MYVNIVLYLNFKYNKKVYKKKNNKNRFKLSTGLRYSIIIYIPQNY